jgi:hypothetical protein
VDQALTHVLGGGFAGSCTSGNSLTGAIVLDHLRVIHRDVGGALLEVVHRVAALAQDLHDQLVRLSERDCRLIHEPRLDLLPLRGVSVLRGGRKGPDIELFPSFAASGEICLGLATAIGMLQRAVVLGADWSRSVVVRRLERANQATTTITMTDRHDRDE